MYNSGFYGLIIVIQFAKKAVTPVIHRLQWFLFDSMDL
jgi:hypothetical protein